MKINLLFFSFLFLFKVFIGHSQELNCKVQVATPKIQRTDKRIFTTLQNSINEFMNETKWSNYTFLVEEKIECSILINISEEMTDTRFKGTIQIQARRPIYNSSYNSVLFNFIDKNLVFEYEEYQTLEFNDASFISNLTSVLAYYAYLIIGLDLDSYTMYGGSAMFEKAQNVTVNAQNAPEPGWKSLDRDKNNRYWIIENLLNQSYSNIRLLSYTIHRKALDVMYDNVENGKKEALASLELLQKVNRQKSNLIIVKILMMAKGDEYVNIFSEASPMIKDKASKILIEIDPTNATKYRKLTSLNK